MCPSLIKIGSKTAEKNSAQTNKQTNRQTDTTKIMVTWPWTKNSDTAVLFGDPDVVNAKGILSNEIKPLEFQCQILVFIPHASSLLLCLRAHQELHLVVFLYDYNIWSSVFSHVVRLVWIVTSQRILTFSVSIIGSAVRRYHCSEHGRPYFSVLYSLQYLYWNRLSTIKLFF